MKKLLATAAVLTVIVTPAFAQSFNSSYGTANIAPMITANSPDGVFRYPSTDHGKVQRHAAIHRHGTDAFAQAAPKISAHRPNAVKNDDYQGPYYGVTGGTGWYSQDGW